MLPNLKESQNKIEELESIRGIAACLIILYHIPIWNPVINLNFIRNGYLMVQLFFVLSGYIIYSSYSKKLKSKKDVLRFQFLRFGRIYPVHFIFLLVYIIFELAKYIAENKFNIVSPNTQPFRENNIIAIFQNIFLIQAIGPTGNTTSFNGPAWSISVEFYTYFLFALIILYLEKIKAFVFIIIISGSLILIITKNDFGFDSLLQCCCGFFLGCTIAFLEGNIYMGFNKYLSLMILIGMIIFLLFKTENVYDPYIFILSSLLILTLTVNKKGFLNEFLKIRFLTWLGKISFSLYMSHYCVIWIVNQFIRVILKKNEIFIYNKSTPQLGIIETITCIVIIIPIILLISKLVYEYIETPFRLKSRIYASSIIIKL